MTDLNSQKLSTHQVDEFMKKVNQLTKLGYKKTRLRPTVKTLLECLAYQALIVDRNTKSFLTYLRITIHTRIANKEKTRKISINRVGGLYMHEIEQGLSTLQKIGLIQYQTYDNGVQYSLNIEQIEKMSKE